MISLLVIKFGHSLWSKYKINKIIRQRQHKMEENKKKKRISIYAYIKRKKSVLKNKNTPKRISTFTKNKQKRIK